MICQKHLTEYGIAAFYSSNKPVVFHLLMSKVPKSYYKDLLSSISKISAGIPQGSGLGLLLFFISVNGVAVNILSIRRLFADDN